MKKKIAILFTSILIALYACGGGGGSSASSPAPSVPAPSAGTGEDLRSKNLVNQAAYIPSQCYTVTQDSTGVHNPCYSCHQSSVKPNYSNDSDLQETYSFPSYADTNNWTNLFVDRSARVAEISDSGILGYVRQDNYKDSSGNIILAGKLADVPAGWDFNGDGEWSGYIPDCYFSFDSDGFDRTAGGDYTGWRAYAYAPFLGTFWPTNGSADDVLIRLPEDFRRDANGSFSLEVYKLNLAIVESLIKMRDTAIDPVDESVYGIDLDGDGVLGTASVVKYDWAPTQGIYMHYVGLAGVKEQAGTYHVAAGLFPEGTEFLHSVRYLNVTDGGEVTMASRMKELRYARKKTWYTYSALELAHQEEVKEKHDFPDRLETFIGNVESGISNGKGWTYQAFIEDADGGLRPQTYEETLFCMGCHTGLGATVDSIFTFSRKFAPASYQRGWYHWTQKDLSGTPEQTTDYGAAGTQYEYSYYLTQNHSGDEFRENSEVKDKFFNPDGSVKQDMINALHSDVTVLLIPSAERALAMSKAYRVIVSDQSFVYGRDASVVPSANVYRSIDTDNKPTGITSVLSATNTGPDFD